MKKNIITAWLIMAAYWTSGAQVITPDDAIRSAMATHPTAKAAALGVQAKTFSEKSALNLPNPEVNMESPTGEFYAVGVLQSFEFPTVYVRQKQVAKAETALARAAQKVTENDLRYNVRVLYLEAQAGLFVKQQWFSRDSLYRLIAAASQRQFDAGEIDFLQKTLVENEVSQVHEEWRASEQTAATALDLLAGYAGVSSQPTLQPLQADSMILAAPEMNNPAVAYEQQAVQLAENQVSLEKSRALPNFSIGYLNQGPRNTPLDYRFRASVGIPLWVGQYKAGANAARAESEAAAARANAQTQAVMLQYERTATELLNAYRKVQYYEKEALPRSRTIISTALRLREAGQTDYVTFLRTLDEAYSIQRDYAAELQRAETARIQLLYLSGQ